MSLPNAFVTLLTTSSYLPGALVLLHSLLELHPAPRDFKTVCLVTPETVDVKTIGELRKAGWDLVIGVEGIGSGVEGQQGLDLMGRPDLNLALTKLHLFRLHSFFSTLIYLDADVLPIRPIAHLFQSTNPHVLSACPDIGWPDCFNSGVMVIRPRESDWDGMRKLLRNGEGEDGIYTEGGEGPSGNGSFDGADQGLLNEWFSEEGGGGNWNRLPFLYNVTPSAAYQYKPAYTRYGHKINCIHFIGPHKPWANIIGRPAGMSVTKKDYQSFDFPSLIDRWFDVYDRHVRPTAAHTPDLAKRFAVPEHTAVWNLSSGVPVQPEDRLDLDQLKAAGESGVSALKPGQYMSLPLDGRIDLIMPKPKPVKAPSPTQSPTALSSPPATQAPPPQTLQQQTSQPATWDASREAPPQHGKPEMSIRMDTFYAPAWEQSKHEQSAYYSQAQAPSQSQYPTLPASVTGDSWYKEYHGRVPDRQNLKAVFPWEQPGHQSRRPDRVFPQGDSPPLHLESSKPILSLQPATPPITEAPARQPSPPQARSMQDAMSSYTNAWDSMPSIQRYVSKITGRPNAPRNLGIRSSDLDPMVLHTESHDSSTTRFKPSEDRRSDASGDGDDEDEGDEEADPESPTQSFNGQFGQQMSAGYPTNEKYRDRHAQTDKPHMMDAKVQFVPGGGPSPAVKAIDIPKLVSNASSSSTATIRAPIPVRRPRVSGRQSSSSDTPRASGGGPLTPPSDAVTSSGSRRIPFPIKTNNGSPILPGSSSSSGLGSTGRPSYTIEKSMEQQAVPPVSTQPAERYFDPSTDVDVRKRDTQAVLSRFMQVGSFAKDGKGDSPK